MCYFDNIFLYAKFIVPYSFVLIHALHYHNCLVSNTSDKSRYSILSRMRYSTKHVICRAYCKWRSGTRSSPISSSEQSQSSLMTSALIITLTGASDLSVLSLRFTPSRRNSAWNMFEKCRLFWYTDPNGSHHRNKYYTMNGGIRMAHACVLSLLGE